MTVAPSPSLTAVSAPLIDVNPTIDTHAHITPSDATFALFD
jgi:hypothetical protein